MKDLERLEKVVFEDCFKSHEDWRLRRDSYCFGKYNLCISIIKRARVYTKYTEWAKRKRAQERSE